MVLFALWPFQHGAPDLSHAADAEHLDEPVRTNAGNRPQLLPYRIVEELLNRP